MSSREKLAMVEIGMRLLLPLLVLLYSLESWSQPLRVGVPSPGQVPFFWQDDSGRYQGIYPDTLRLIASQLDLPLEFETLSQARLHRHFISGLIDIEMGVSTRQQEAVELQRQSLLTHPYGMVNEVIIYRPELSFPVFILKDLQGQRVATVRGSTVPKYLVREDVANEWQIAQRVHRGWNDIGLMKEAVAMHIQRENQLDYEISLPYASNPVAFRLHRQQQQWLEPINQTIDRLKQQGQLEALVCKYLCGVVE